MQKRKLVSLKCPRCLKNRTVRADGAGKYCRSCSAIFRSRARIGKIENLVGNTYGRLTVISYAVDYLKKYHWNCLCECGKKVVVARSRLKNGQTRSCGCITRTQKGLSQSPTYRSWDSMLQRCYDSTVAHYDRYGAKGITVCERWRNSFLDFLQDMGERPEDHTLDRIDNTENYNKENCRWATNSEQGNNRSNNHMISAFGKIQTLTQWANETGIGWSTIRKRIGLGWPIEKVLTKRVNNGCKIKNKKHFKEQNACCNEGI